MVGDSGILLSLTQCFLVLLAPLRERGQSSN